MGLAGTHSGRLDARRTSSTACMTNSVVEWRDTTMGVWWRLAAQGNEVVFDRELFAIRTLDPAVAKKAGLVQVSIISLEASPITFALSRGLPQALTPFVDAYGTSAIMVEDLGTPTGPADPDDVMSAFTVLADASWYHTKLCAARFGHQSVLYSWGGLRTDSLDNSTMQAAVDALQLQLATSELSSAQAQRLQQLVIRFS